MIELNLGNVGSGKTAKTVREMINTNDKKFITNIDIHKKEGIDTSHIKRLKPEHIINKELIKTNQNGKKEFEYSLNTDYWKNLIKKEKNVNIIIDEAHTFFNPRRSMSKLNIIMTDFLALLRRVLGSSDSDSGKLVLISQLSRRLDVIAKEMATKISYSKCYYMKYCYDCGASWQENNELPDKMYKCLRCNSPLIQKDLFLIEVFEFNDIFNFDRFYNGGQRTYYNRYIITDIQSYFGFYNTLQWDDMITFL